MIALRRRWAAPMLVVVFVGASVGVAAIRRPILRAAGWALVVNERVEPSDIIVVSVDADGAGVLEAADLVHSGVATRVAVFADPPDAVDREFIRRGIPYEDAGARSIRQLRALGVDNIDRIPTSVKGTEDEGPVLADWCDQHRFRSVVVVSSVDHSRRHRRVPHRSTKGQARVTVRCARYFVFDPARWGKHTAGSALNLRNLRSYCLTSCAIPIS